MAVAERAAPSNPTCRAEFITVVLPAYNEELNLEPLVSRIDEQLCLSGYAHRIIIVDDGSVDNTLAVARDLAKRFPVQIAQHQHNRGLGAAVQTGLDAALQSAEGGIVVLMDADNSHDPGIIDQMVAKIAAGDDVVIASRFQRGGEVVGVAFYRRILSSGLSLILRVLCGYPNIRDYSSGFRAYRFSTLCALQDKFGDKIVEETGFACMFELLLKLRAVKARAAEIPLVLRYDFKRGRSKMRTVQTISRYSYLISQMMCRSVAERVL